MAGTSDGKVSFATYTRFCLGPHDSSNKHLRTNTGGGMDHTRLVDSLEEIVVKA